MTPTWELECEDSLAKMRQFIPKTFQLTMTSPPYFGKLRRYGGKGPLMTLIEYVNWQVACIAEAVRITDGVVLWVANNPVIGGRYRAANEMILSVLDRDDGVVIKRPIIWHKNAGSSAKDWLRNDYEQILVFGNPSSKMHCDWMQIAQPKKFKTGGVYRQRNQTGTRVVGGKYPKNVFANPGDVLRISVGGGQMGYDKEDDKLACSGFAPYPYNIADQLVRVFSKPGDCVFDPFAGTCTTGVAALVNERDFVGVDNDPAAIKVGQTRLARAISCPPLPDED